ncbi:MAG: hypothetical protein AAGD92_03390 [Pseudomonadota bacterium]
MTHVTTDSLLKFSALFTDAQSGKSPMDCAIERGWVNDYGELTPSGKQTAIALEEQSKTRTAFRIG